MCVKKGGASKNGTLKGLFINVQELSLDEIREHGLVKGIGTDWG